MIIADWRQLWRAWSIRVAAIGALLYGFLLTDPTGLQVAWSAIPAEVRAVLPVDVQAWITFALFVLIALARAARQPAIVTREAAPMMLTAAPAWLTAARVPNKRRIISIAVHCSATPEGRDNSAADIRAWHKAQGWVDIGYHFVVRIDGTIEPGRPIELAGAHVAGHNSTSIGVCYVGGVASDAKTPKDTRTQAQKAALLTLLGELKRRYPGAVIKGHRDYPKVAKACPSFDAASEYAKLGA